MVYLLEAFGHETLQVLDGAEGIEVAQREHPDLILLDIHMPQMDGYEVARRLRGNYRCNRIPLVAVTALAMVGDREKILASGFNGYIAKPLDPEAFPGQVNAFLGVRAQENARRPAPAGSTSPAAPHKKIAVVLFVDNMQTNIDLVRSTLEPSGYEVVAALSAGEGIDLAHRMKPDLILSDVHMPHQDGYEFMRMVQADPQLSNIPFVFLSSSVWSAREKEHALMQGAKKFISRPIEPQQLLEQLRDCIPERKE
ncbi:MAG: response regulator [Candidatus Acidiferrales bacterium]